MHKAKSELQKIIAIPEEEYGHFIEQKKMEIVNFHLKNNPFYKELVGETESFKNWSNLPILNKINLQKPLNRKAFLWVTMKNQYILIKHLVLVGIRLFLPKINFAMP